MEEPEIQLFVPVFGVCAVATSGVLRQARRGRLESRGDGCTAEDAHKKFTMYYFMTGVVQNCEQILR